MEFSAPVTEAYILAGGKSRRFGRDKSLYIFKGKPLIQHVYESIKKVIPDIYIISGEKSKYSFLTDKVIGDIIPELGPIGGLHAAISHTKADRIFLFACDTPFLSSDFIEYMNDIDLDYEIIAPFLNGFYEPLHAIYSKKCQKRLYDFIDSGKRKISEFVSTGDVRPVIEEEIDFYEDPMKLFRNLNNHEDASLLH